MNPSRQQVATNGLEIVLSVAILLGILALAVWAITLDGGSFYG